MRFIGLLKRDFALGTRQSLPYLIGGFFIGLMLGVGSIAQAFAITGSIGGFTLGDLVAFAMDFPASISIQQLIMGRAVSFSYSWVLPFACAFAAVLDYPRSDLEGMGRDAMVFGGSRLSWWCAKCAWTLCVLVLYWILVFAGICAIAFLSGSFFSLSVGVGCASSLRSSLAPYGFGMTAVPLLISVAPVTGALALAQLAISLFWNRIPGYVAVMAVLVGTSFFAHPLLPSFYLISGRSLGIYYGGAALNQGLAFSIAFAWAMVAVGGILISRKTIFGGSDNG